MRLLNLLNALLWFINAAMWAFYAHVPVIACSSLIAALGSYWLSREEW